MENNFEKQFVVGVDIGGQTSKIGVVNTRGEVLSQIVIRSDIYGSERSSLPFQMPSRPASRKQALRVR